ncbi:MAG: hypothetical protein ACLGG0_01000 [Bacteriovoracia bacterium]
MKSFLLLLACTLITSSAFARNPVSKECKAEAEGIVFDLHAEYLSGFDFVPMIRSFSSKDAGSNIIHYVQVVIDGNSSFTTVELRKGSCNVVYVD